MAVLRRWTGTAWEIVSAPIGAAGGGGGGGAVDLANYVGPRIGLEANELGAGGVDIVADWDSITLAANRSGSPDGGRVNLSGGQGATYAGLTLDGEGGVVTLYANGDITITDVNGSIRFAAPGAGGSIQLEATDAAGLIQLIAGDMVRFASDGSVMLDAPLVLINSADVVHMKGFVNHGSTAGVSRPAGYISIEWYGSVEPTNAIDGDTWIDSTP